LKSGKTLQLGYDLENSDFKALLTMMALGSKANFSYFPSDEDIVAYCTREGTLPHAKQGQMPVDAISSDKRQEVC